MVEINMYPYRIRITDPDLIKAFEQVSRIGFCRVKPQQARRIGYKIPRKIKRDGVIINKGIFTIYNARIRLDHEPSYGKRKGMDFIFKTVF